MKFFLNILVLVGITLSVNAQNTRQKIYVGNEVEFINALNNNTKIIIKADTLNFSEEHLEKLLGEKRRNNYFAPNKSYFITAGLHLYGYKNLSIQGKKNTYVITDNNRDDVLVLEKCKFFTLKNLTFSTKKGFHPSSTLLSLLQCEGLLIENSTFLQGGTALYTLGSAHINFQNTVLQTETENSIIKAINSKDIEFNESEISRNISLKVDRSHGRVDVKNTSLYKNDFIELKNSDITFNQTIVNNQKTVHQKTGEINDINYANSLKSKILYREKIITDFINSLEETTSSKNYAPAYLTSFFNEGLEQFLDTKKATHKTVYDFFYDEFYIHREFELISIVPFNQNIYYVKFKENKILNKNDFNEIQETQYSWTITFNEENYFYSISSNKEKKEYKTHIGLPEIPKLKNKDLEAYLLWCNEYISVHYLELTNDPEATEYPTAFLDEITFQLNHFAEILHLYEEKPLSKIDATDKAKMNTYLYELKQFSWYDLYSKLKPYEYEDEEAEENMDSEYLRGLLSVFDNLWSASLFQYSGDKKLEIAGYNTNILNTKIPYFSDAEVTQFLKRIYYSDMNSYLSSINSTYNHNFFENRMEYLYGCDIEEVTKNLSPNEILVFNNYITDYKKVLKELDTFLSYR